MRILALLAGFLVNCIDFLDFWGSDLLPREGGKKTNGSYSCVFGAINRHSFSVFGKKSTLPLLSLVFTAFIS